MISIVSSYLLPLFLDHRKRHIPELNRTVTIYASGSVNVDNALEPSKSPSNKMILERLMLGEAMGTPLSGARITRLFTPFFSSTQVLLHSHIPFYI